MSCGRAGALCIEWAVEGLELSTCGRGGSGGGVPSRDGKEMLLDDVVHEALFIMLSVGLAKSCWSTLPLCFEDALLP
jgi:hypothetical protein